MTFMTNLTLRQKMYTIDFSRPKETNEALLDFFMEVQKIKGHETDFYYKIMNKIVIGNSKFVDFKTVQLAKSIEQEIIRSA
ncbi:hypothetical protein E6W99_20910 [Metabacillus sediminilitoris]|uniref:Uncharacterized protein n=2 Tax=Metabacillus sediminilitoris TaxID=2567941 RepID=A0A4S4BP40_9BACI|nr:hypothetical protein GMB29_09970 [Metabacillus sediminilitoris]THF76610.1 hypothetical protein E6W99_20910 [Metabacillus sediminilitoris]